MILEKIQNDLSVALKSKDEATVSTLRFLLAAVKDKEIELNKRGKLTDEEVIGVIQKQVKQHKESIEAYQKGGRSDLSDKESKELSILSNYLPQQISPEDLEKIVSKAVNKIGASGPGDFGRVMGEVMGEVKGIADGGQVAKVVKKLLSK